MVTSLGRGATEVHHTRLPASPAISRKHAVPPWTPPVHWPTCCWGEAFSRRAQGMRDDAGKQCPKHRNKSCA
jgi:hypothetical protein